MAGPPPRRPDPDAIASPVIVTVADLFGRLEELHQEHFQRSKQLLQEIKAHRETEAKAASLKSSDYTGRIDAEQHCLEEELQSHLSWGRDVLSGIRAPLSAQSGAMETAPVANEVEAVTIRMSEARQSPTNMSSMEDSAEVAPMPKGGSTPRPRRQSTVAPKGLAALMKRPVVRWTLYVCLAIALFGPGMVTLLDLPDEPTVIIMDILMFIIAVAFTLEMLGLLMVDELYRYSFFFAMDLLGTLSMAFEISFLLGQLVNSNTVVLRTARTAKLGARIGRLIKLVKCVSMFYRSSGKKSSQVEAKVLASKLVVLLSTRVSVIVILMVMVVPLSTLPLHPTEDLSLSLWPNKLEESYFQDQTNQTTNALEQSIDQMVQFYQRINYHPYLVRGFGASQSLANSPLRARNTLEVTLENCLVQRVCNAAVLFDFTSPAQLDALVEVVTIAFIIGLMALTSCDLQQVVDANLVKPLEGMLQHVRENAAHIFERFSKQTQAADLDSEENEDTGASEIELIQLILKKLARLATLAEVSTHAVTQNELENMNAERKAVLLDMLNVQVLPAPMLGFPSAKRPTQLDFEVSWTQSWDLNFLDTSPEEMHKYVHYMFFSSQFGVAYHYVTEEIFSQFVHNVEGNYKDVPYHRFHHGVDVLFTVFRLLQLSHAGKWTGEIEQYALLVASLCHDLGHFGKTNQFLVEIKHELALRYNDKSPLENMHCAMLFQLCQHAGQDVFADATEEQQKEARKIAISVILHTDNVHHFDMVKDVSAVYEMDSEICDAQAAAPEVITQAYREKVLLGKNKMMWLQLFLHFADVSNPLKPFEICKAWAWRVLDEFFAQGDEEKSLGIPVGMLNDREKVNRPGSQHGFINFLVAPFVAASVRVFPGLQPMHAQMVSNLEEWRNIWIEDAKPTAEDIAKKDADVAKLWALDAELLARRDHIA
ncbi:unnamed protein product [Durusdinium trenchii]